MNAPGSNLERKERLTTMRIILELQLELIKQNLKVELESPSEGTIGLHERSSIAN